jgi:putative flippase GtrA
VRRKLSLPAQFLRYLACGGLAALVNFVAGGLLVDGFGFTSAVEFPLAVAIAYGLGMLVNLLLNRRFTFASDRSGIDQARTFIVVALSGLVLTTATAALARAGLAWAMTGGGLLPGMVGPLATPETLSRGLAIALVSVYSFAGHKYLTFHRGIRRPLLQLVQALRFGGSVGYD